MRLKIKQTTSITSYIYGKTGHVFNIRIFDRFNPRVKQMNNITAATPKARSEDNKSKDILENRKNKTKRSDGGRKNYINELFNCL